MTFRFKFNGIMYAVAVSGEKPPSQVVLPDSQVVEMKWNQDQAYEIDPVACELAGKKASEISYHYNLPLAQLPTT